MQRWNPYFSQSTGGSNKNLIYFLFQVAILSKYRTPEDSSVFQMIALSVVGLIVFLVAFAIVLKTIGNLFFFYQS